MQDTLATGELYGVKLKKDLSGLMGEPVFISGASQTWEKVNWDRNRCNEGAYVFKKNGKYYMTYSANDTGYEFYGVGVSYADSPLGPWVKSEDNPLLTTDLPKGVFCTGTQFDSRGSDGDLYIVYHRMLMCIAKNRIGIEWSVWIDYSSMKKVSYVLMGHLLRYNRFVGNLNLVLVL